MTLTGGQILIFTVYYRASERNERGEFVRGLVEKSKYERPDTARPRGALDELISLQPRVRLTNGHL